MLAEKVIEICLDKFFGCSDNAPEYDANKLKEILEHLEAEGHIVCASAQDDVYLRERMLDKALSESHAPNKVFDRADSYFNYVKTGAKPVN